MLTTCSSNRPPRARRHARLGIILCALALAIGIPAIAPASAEALTVERLTARPNADDGSNGIIGGVETRITWQAEVTAAEQLSEVTLTLPDGTSYRSADTKVTLYTGADRMDRNAVDVEISTEGQTLTFDLGGAIDQDGLLDIQVYGVVFPAAGGVMQVTGTYDADGATHAMENVPAVDVVGVSVFTQISQYLAQQEWVQRWNENKFLKLFFDPTILVTSFPVVFQGFLMSLAIVALGFPLAIPVGLLLAVMRRARLAFVRAIASIYVNIVRGTPLFLQIYIAFFGLPLAGIQIPSFPLGVMVVVMNSGAYLCEIFRAGIQSIDRGQTEAARSLGMSATQTLFSVIRPQMFRRVIPNLTNEFITLYKDTSLLAAVGVMELVMYAKTIVASTGSITPYIVAAVFYLIITLPLSAVTRRLEERVSMGRRRKRPRAGSDGAAPRADAPTAADAAATRTTASAPSAAEH